jgi:hypothetical protein
VYSGIWSSVIRASGVDVNGGVLGGCMWYASVLMHQEATDQCDGEVGSLGLNTHNIWASVRLERFTPDRNRAEATLASCMKFKSELTNSILNA